MSIRAFKLHGRKVWQARVAYRGQRMSTIRPSKAEAKTAEAELLGKLQARAGQLAALGGAPATVRGLLEGYAERLAARGKGPDTIGRAASTALAVERLTPALLDKPVGAVIDGDLFAFRQARVRGGTKPATINRDLRTLRAALKAARPDYRFPADAFFREDNTRVRWLRPEDELLLFASMPQPFRDMAQLAVLTLMRLSEVRLLRRDMVRLEQGVILLPQAKGGARAVILSGAAQQLCRAQLAAVVNREWVFPGPDGVPYSRIHVSRVFRKASRAAGLEDFHFHDLRHHGATAALNSGFTSAIVQSLGGWKSDAMMRRYGAITDGTLRRAAEAVAGNREWQQAANPAPTLAER